MSLATNIKVQLDLMFGPNTGQGDIDRANYAQAMANAISGVSSGSAIVTVSSAYTIQSTDLYVMLTGNSSYVVTLPTPTSGRQITIKDTDGSATNYPKTIATSSGTIDGDSYYTFGLAWGGMTLLADGTNWFVISVVTSQVR